ncbi:hypothetical protein VNO78_02955 [Psophocarpus tetragonolobus]|uniref:Uncharacterized protein n=1 Tax=Psophocarpus tetragonolobus TaxID=3891 RepID=A0AAN9TC14_PSOTE
MGLRFCWYKDIKLLLRESKCAPVASIFTNPASHDFLMHMNVDVIARVRNLMGRKWEVYLDTTPRDSQFFQPHVSVFLVCHCNNIAHFDIKCKFHTTYDRLEYTLVNHSHSRVSIFRRGGAWRDQFPLSSAWLKEAIFSIITRP